jgi:signal peptidase II
MKRVWRLSLVLLIVLCCAGCDRATKHVARRTLASSPPISLLNDSVRFEYSENPGAFLGLGSNLPSAVRLLLFVIFSGAGVLLALVYIARVDRLDLTPTIALSLLAGGGVGNLVDRISNNGAVTDFVRLGIGPLRTGIFNLADVAIVVGVLLLFLWSAGGRTDARDAENR